MARWIEREIDVTPSQPKQLAAPRPGHGGKGQIEVQQGIRFRHGLEKTGDLGRSWRPHLGGDTPGRAGVRGHVVKTHNQRSAWARAACRVKWMRRTVPTASGSPSSDRSHGASRRRRHHGGCEITDEDFAEAGLSMIEARLRTVVGDQRVRPMANRGHRDCGIPEAHDVG
jgi:hypothetical protein